MQFAFASITVLLITVLPTSQNRMLKRLQAGLRYTQLLTDYARA